MPPLHLHLHGPLTFVPGERSLFHSEFRASACVYLWTVRSALDGGHYVHYVGEAQSFARRQREHLVQVLGLNYGIFDPAAARHGDPQRVWDGMWRDRSPDAPGRALAHYVAGAAAVVEYVGALSVFVAPVAGDRALRRRIEGAIARRLRTVHPEAKRLYPDDNRAAARAPSPPLQVELAADEPIIGLDAALEV